MFKFELNGEEKEFDVLKPTAKMQREAQYVNSRVFNEACERGVMLESQIDDILRKAKVWNDDKEVIFKTLTKEINDIEMTLAKGDKNMKLSDARSLALKLKHKRKELGDLLSVRADYMSKTAEGMALDASYHYLASVCLVYSDNRKPVYKSLDDYYENCPQELQGKAINGIFELQLNPQRQSNLPENKFLMRFGFMNKEMQLVDKQGRLVDEGGRLVNEDGRFINEEGQFVDIEGNLIDEDGNYVVEFEGFQDEDGNIVSGE